MESPRKDFKTYSRFINNMMQDIQAWYVLMSVGPSIFSWLTNASSEFGVYLNPKMEIRAKFILHKHC